MAAVAVPPAPSIPTTKHMCSCSKCGIEIPHTAGEEARRRITELEMQVELLKEKATAAGRFQDAWSPRAC